MDLSCRQLTGAQAIADVDVRVVEDIFVPRESILMHDRLDSCYRIIATTPILNHVRDEYTRTERRELDDVIFDSIGLTQNERDAVYEAVINLVEARLKKAASV